MGRFCELPRDTKTLREDGYADAEEYDAESGVFTVVACVSLC